MGRLHHHNGDVVFPEDLVQRPGRPVEPVVVVQLNLHKVPWTAGKHLLQGVRRAVEGESEIPDLSQPLLLPEILRRAVIQIVGDQLVRHPVEQIEVDAVHLEPVQLPGKLFFIVRFRLYVEFVGHIEAVPGIPFQRLSQKHLGLPHVVDIRRVKVVDPVGDAEVDQLHSLRFINGFCKPRFCLGQTHRPHAQLGQLEILKLVIPHTSQPVLSSYWRPRSGPFQS